MADEPWRHDPYLEEGDDGRPVMRNLVGVTNAHVLRLVEYRQTMLRTIDIRLGNTVIPQTGDVQQWTAIHAHLFGGLYDWAGSFRVNDMARRGVSFCPRYELEAYAHQIVEQTTREPWADLDRAAYVEAAAVSLTALNAAHPFPEGNGRSTRLFFDQLSSEAVWTIDYGATTKARWNDAFRDTMARTSPYIDAEPVAYLLDGMVEPVGETSTADESMPELMRRVLDLTTKMTHLTAPGRPVLPRDDIRGIVAGLNTDHGPEPPGIQLD